MFLEWLIILPEFLGGERSLEPPVKLLVLLGGERALGVPLILPAFLGGDRPLEVLISLSGDLRRISSRVHGE